ncbi:MAG: hydrolase [Pseudomonadales bacterium]|nr:MAG: hydrolase [Pseudomonadales bacterium]
MSFLIKGCELLEITGLQDVRISHGVIEKINSNILPIDEDTVIHASGGLLLPGLHDHHIHLLSLAASLNSVHCGPGEVQTEAELSAILQAENNNKTTDWLRGIGYHESVAGDISRDWLDAYIPDRPARIQHRGGRLWVLNSAGLEALGLLNKASEDNLPQGLEKKDNGRLTGRLYENDAWLRNRLPNKMPDLSEASYRLASCGVSSITDTSPSNGVQEWNHFHSQQKSGKLLQAVRVMGSLNFDRELKKLPTDPLLTMGEYKVHLLESDLPNFDTLCSDMTEAHLRGRNIAIHCVTHTELVFAISCLEEVGIVEGDRIEHASITSPKMVSRLSENGLRVVTQPHFISERGDQYLHDVEIDEQPYLYRLQSFLKTGVALAAGSDAPFGGFDPWSSIRAATRRRPPNGVVLGENEVLSPEQALALYTSDPAKPGLRQRSISPGEEASLCLLNKPWAKAREILSSDMVTRTWHLGKLIYSHHYTRGQN